MWERVPSRDSLTAKQPVHVVLSGVPVRAATNRSGLPPMWERVPSRDSLTAKQPVHVVLRGGGRGRGQALEFGIHSLANPHSKA